MNIGLSKLDNISVIFDRPKLIGLLMKRTRDDMVGLQKRMKTVKANPKLLTSADCMWILIEAGKTARPYIILKRRGHDSSKSC